MALHSRSEGWVNGRRNEGCRDRTRSSAQRARVSVACELRPRAAGFNNTGSYASGIRNILRGRWKIESTDSARRDECRGWALNEWTSCRDYDGSFQQRDDRIDRAYNVRCRRDQAVLGAGQIRVGQNRSKPSALREGAYPVSAGIRGGPVWSAFRNDGCAPGNSLRTGVSLRAQRNDLPQAMRVPSGRLLRFARNDRFTAGIEEPGSRHEPLAAAPPRHHPA